MKKLLLTHRYYWPDTAPYGLILHEIAKGMDSSFDTQVFSTTPSYAKTKAQPRPPIDDQHSVTRIAMLDERKSGILGRLLNALWYAFRLFLHVLRIRPNIVTASTFPPILAAVSAGLASKLVKANFVYVLMDIYPDVTFIGKSKGMLYRSLKWIDNLSLQLADVIIVLSADMKQSLIKRGIPSNRIRVIGNVELRDGSSTPISNTNYRLPELRRDRINIAFCGNIGNFQGLDTFSEVIRSLSEKKIAHFYFMGEGKMKQVLQEKFANECVSDVTFIPRMPVEVARKWMSQVDLNLVSLSPGVSACSFPSKTSTISAVGGAFLVYNSRYSQLNQLILEYGAGIAGDSEAHDLTIDKIIALANDKTQLQHYREGSAKLYKAHFDRDNILNAWKELFHNLDDSFSDKTSGKS